MNVKLQRYIALAALALLQAVRSTDQNTYQSYQDSITCIADFPSEFPSSLEDIQNLVVDSLENGIRLKAVGSQHSISDSICTEGISVHLTKIQHFIYNPDNQTAMVGAGMQLMDFLDKLNDFNRTILSPPMYGGITIGGAIGNGAHGTGFLNPSLSDSILSVVIVNGSGSVKTVKKGDKDFSATVNLGLLGIVYQVEFATVKQFKLNISQYLVNEDDILWNITDIKTRAIRFGDHFNFWWFPTAESVVMSEGSRVSMETPENCQTTMVLYMTNEVTLAYSSAFENFQSTRNHLAMFQMQTFAMFKLFRDVKGQKPFFVQEDAKTSCLNTPIGLSHKMKVNRCKPCYWEGEGNVLKTWDSEIIIPVDSLSDALREFQNIFKVRLSNFPMNALWIRFVSSGSSLMGINKGGNGWATIEWVTPIRWSSTEPRLAIAAFQAMGKILIEKYGGRPHLGKNGLLFSEPDIIRKAHSSENVDEFLRIRKLYDPSNLFLNSFGERLLGTDNALEVEPKLSEACGLNEVCDCQVNTDCGNDEQLSLDYTCTSFSDSFSYLVCSPRRQEEQDLIETPARLAIEKTAYNETTVVDALMKYPELKNVFT